MSVKEYASEQGYTVQEVLDKCKELGLKITKAGDILDDDSIIVLDNSMNLISSDKDTTHDDEEVLDEVVEDILSETNLIKEQHTVRKQKLNKRKEQDKNEYSTKKKAMYKSKTKLKTNEETDDNVAIYKEGMTVSDFALALNVNLPDLIKKLMSLGLMLNQNQEIDFENAEIIALDYKKVLKKEETQDISNFEEYEIIDKEEDLKPKPPVITVMGHVDHGKTTLLDYLRKSNVAEGEAGGITQAIGSYQIDYKGNKITFIDTPGHAAFTEMRARGTSVTDIVILIVAADDGVMPQTKEAAEHALSANVPIVVAVNKIDKPEANPDRIKEGMAALNITPEDWGGNVPFVNISALTGEGIDNLLETVLAIAEMNELKANPNRYASGTVIESRIDKNLGGVASLLIQNGTLRLGDPIVVGTAYGKVRTLKNDQGKEIVSAGPSMPVEITGLSDNPSAGDKFMAFETEKKARSVSEKRAALLSSIDCNKKAVTFEDLFEKIQSGTKEINVVLKCDVRGSEEAIKSSLDKIDVEGVKIKIIRSGIGTITESDIVLANASDAIIIGFNVVPSAITREVAREYCVEIRLYQVIYKLIEEVELAMKGLLDPEFEEKIIGNAEVRKLFSFSKVGTIAGVYVTNGIVKNKAKIRVIRDGVIIYDGIISSIQREQDQVREVKSGFECGITIENFNDIKEKDEFEIYEDVEVKR
ncbi:MAG TPA: translation initiation factor IF-2 [Mollicutes bacterium]|nr:translation initiation factor IF-2 [Mollicutes bacterium]